jgi:hypothetical protein
MLTFPSSIVLLIINAVRKKPLTIFKRILAVSGAALVISFIFILVIAPKTSSEKTVAKIHKKVSAAINGETITALNECSDNSPEKALFLYLQCWENKQWQDMVNYTQQSWRSTEDDARKTLEDYCGVEVLTNFEISKLHKIPSDGLVTINARITYNLGTKIVHKKLTVNVMKENGDWGVNPISALRQDDIK